MHNPSANDPEAASIPSPQTVPAPAPRAPSVDSACHPGASVERVREIFRCRAPQRRPQGGRGPGRRDTYDHDMTAITDIIDSIESRLRELNEEIGALSAARDVLDGHDSRAPRGRRGAVTIETRSGPSKDASGAGRVQAAVEPDGPASTAPARPSLSTPREPARRRTRANADRTVEVVPAGKLELLLSDTGGLVVSPVSPRPHALRVLPV
jgi:hypothetical protein